MTKITINVPLDGPVNVSVEGHDGPGCKDLTKDLEKALGKVESVEKTADFAKPERSKNRVSAR